MLNQSVDLFLVPTRGKGMPASTLCVENFRSTNKKRSNKKPKNTNQIKSQPIGITGNLYIHLF
ncbi:hypothetical protein THIOM_003478 [Candidatus Thiomargarita nelsonii]|uniref:Uncharacterized protein n=1 Tax=Candidatus Thiomargarita nelsonii TaxID=1003181 RepID=A0A176RYG3_9GAMM|nr:hypothetical protein THIOM_003478 [Candidatus Thiomargarita nelsonii]